MLIARGGRTVLVADTNVSTCQARKAGRYCRTSAATARALGHEPRVAMLLIRLSGTLKVSLGLCA